MTADKRPPFNAHFFIRKMEKKYPLYIRVLCLRYGIKYGRINPLEKEYPYPEIGKKLNIKREQLRVYLRNAKKVLRKIYGKFIAKT